MTKESTIQPFAPGDILVGATLLNNPDDDHAGDGRIIQYDSDLNEKGVLWLDGTTHLITGLKFAPDGTLWAFDSATYSVLNISPEGKQLPNPKFPERSFSNVIFLDDGSVLVGEHLVGAEIRLPPDRPLGTTLSFMPGTERFGDGHVFRCKPDGTVIKEYATKAHGGMPAFLGINNTVMAPDGKTLQYLSELSDGVYQYDIEADKQLDDLLHYPKDSGEMAMSLNRGADGELLHIRANFRVGFFLDLLNEDGSRKREYALPGPGWACLGNSATSGVALLGNFFTGAVAKFDMASGEIIAQADTGVERSLAGIAQVPG